jgi:hypothetical protein
MTEEEEEFERRLCGGCNEAKSKGKFAVHEWQKEDAWRREAARRCRECNLLGGCLSRSCVQGDVGVDMPWQLMGARKW